MSAERDQDQEATIKMPRVVPKIDDELENFDPEQTLVREDLKAERG